MKNQKINLHNNLLSIEETFSDSSSQASGSLASSGQRDGGQVIQLDLLEQDTKKAGVDLGSPVNLFGLVSPSRVSELRQSASLKLKEYVNKVAQDHKVSKKGSFKRISQTQTIIDPPSCPQSQSTSKRSKRKAVPHHHNQG